MSLPVELAEMPAANLRAVSKPIRAKPRSGRSRMRMSSEIEDSGMIRDHSTPPRNNRGAIPVNSNEKNDGSLGVFNRQENPRSDGSRRVRQPRRDRSTHRP